MAPELATPPERARATPPARLPRGRRIVHWVLATMGARGFVMVLNLGAGVLSARVMGPDLKGIYNAVLLWPGVFFILTSMGLSAAFTSTYGRAGRGERRRIFLVAVWLALLWGTMGAALCTLVAPHLLAHLGSGLGPWIVVGSWVPLPTTLSEVCSSLLAVEERFAWLNWVYVTRPFALLVGLVALAALGHLNPYSQMVLTWATAFGSSLPVIAAALRLGWRLPRRRGAGVPKLVALLSTLGIRYYGIALASTFNSQLDSMLATAWLSATQIGLYAVASSAVAVVGTLSATFGQVFFPMSAADDAATIVRRTSLALRRGLWVFLGVEVAMVALARPTLWILYGSRYRGAWPAVVSLAPEAMCMAAIAIFYAGCYALREFVVPLVGEIVGAVSGFVLLALLIPRWGITGAGAAGSVSYALDLAAVALLWSRRRHVPLRELVPGVADAQAVLRMGGEQVAGARARLGRYLGRLAPSP